MSKLFMEASQRLRDELVTQLQKEVNFLKNYLAKNQKHSIIGTKIIVLPSQHIVKQFKFRKRSIRLFY